MTLLWNKLEFLNQYFIPAVCNFQSHICKAFNSCRFAIFFGLLWYSKMDMAVPMAEIWGLLRNVTVSPVLLDVTAPSKQEVSRGQCTFISSRKSFHLNSHNSSIPLRAPNFESLCLKKPISAWTVSLTREEKALRAPDLLLINSFNPFLYSLSLR